MGPGFLNWALSVSDVGIGRYVLPTASGCDGLGHKEEMGRGRQNDASNWLFAAIQSC